MKKAEPLKELWFVLLVQDENAVLTENPKQETFYSERDAFEFAKESAKEDGDPGAVYYVFRSIFGVRSKRTVRVETVKTAKAHS